MKDCWELECTNRPNFATIKDKLLVIRKVSDLISYSVYL